VVKLNVEELHWLTQHTNFKAFSMCDNNTVHELSKELELNKNSVHIVLRTLIKMGVVSLEKIENIRTGHLMNVYNLTEKGKKYLKSINTVMDDSNV